MYESGDLNHTAIAYYGVCVKDGQFDPLRQDNFGYLVGGSCEWACGWRLFCSMLRSIFDIVMFMSIEAIIPVIGIVMFIDCYSSCCC